MDDEQVLAAVGASVSRRGVAVLLLAGSGVAVIYGTLTTPPALVWQAILIGTGGLAVWMAARMWQATAARIELTATELRGSDGVRIALLSEIASLDRGLLSARPSNGFLIRLNAPAPAAWRPGLWWRMGRRVGVGGVTPGAEARIMADMLARLLAGRDQVSDQTT